MNKIPISGGPHTGKSTLIEALQARFPHAYFLPEPSTKITARELMRQEEDPSYSPLTPWSNVDQFDSTVIEEYVTQEAGLPDEDGLAFQDRSLWDSKAYCKLAGSEHLIPNIERRARAANYTFALFCEPVGIYTQTAIRRESPELALVRHEALRAAYASSGIEIVTLPTVSVEERLAIVEQRLLLI